MIVKASTADDTKSEVKALFECDLAFQWHVIAAVGIKVVGVVCQLAMVRSTCLRLPSVISSKPFAIELVSWVVEIDHAEGRHCETGTDIIKQSARVAGGACDGGSTRHGVGQGQCATTRAHDPMLAHSDRTTCSDLLPMPFTASRPRSPARRASSRVRSPARNKSPAANTFIDSG